ncbi:glycosyltransferase [Nocardia sp. CDC159]|uniref:Glycosyltransferase n=1 Tax=Nocardia pulmonis TaxID=2951408 RepID=A0A9X2IZJ6_9NOCA|nr:MULTISPECIES: glycosyltransferase [Nocardia]MCM6774986.1 glycosyltransferase [Nocardia pulmonis]MCM6789917.1 glycosyltransferase [Nocardia sp. CDC159]
MRITFLGNFTVPSSSETHHALSLEQLGHTVTRLQETRATAREIEAHALSGDLLVWIHTHGWRTPGDIGATLRTLRDAGVRSVSYHLDRWMGLQRQADMRPADPYWQLDHFFTVDQTQADWLNAHTSMRAHYLPAGVYGAECYLAQPRNRFDVAFVGSRGYHPEYPYRPQLIDWLADTYGNRFRHYGGGGAFPSVRGADLNGVYADARVVVGDSLCLDPHYPGRYWSDRIYETLGRGGFLIHPWLSGLDEHFTDRMHVVFYEHGNFEELRALIDHYLRHEDEREAIRLAGHELVKGHHTYTHRWAEILRTIA